jgi:hypothetical protein
MLGHGSRASGGAQCGIPFYAKIPGICCSAVLRPEPTPDASGPAAVFSGPPRAPPIPRLSFYMNHPADDGLSSTPGRVVVASIAANNHSGSARLLTASTHASHHLQNTHPPFTSAISHPRPALTASAVIISSQQGHTSRSDP